MKKIISLMLLIAVFVPALFSCANYGTLSVTFDPGEDLLTTSMSQDDLKEHFTVFYQNNFGIGTKNGKVVTDYNIECDLKEGTCEIRITYKGLTHTQKAFIFDHSKLSQEGDYLFYVGYKSKDYLVKYMGSDTDLVLPERNLYTIYDNVFEGNTSIRSVDIGDSVIRIGENAFASCTSLERIDFGASLVEVCNGAFTLCTALKTVNTDSLENWFSISFNIKNAFYEPPTMLSVFDILDLSFDFHAELTSYAIYPTINHDNNGGGRIEDGCYYPIGHDLVTGEEVETGPFTIRASNPIFHTKGLSVNDAIVTDIVIPESVKSIPDNSLIGSNITSVTFHDDISYIGNGAFYNCNELSCANFEGVTSSLAKNISINSFTEEAYAKYMGGKYLGNAENPYMLLVSASKEDSAASINPNTVAIASCAFRSNDICDELIIPDSVKIIGEKAFSEIDPNVTIYIGSGVSCIKSKSFFAEDYLTGRVTFAEKDGWYYIDSNNNKCYFNFDDCDDSYLSFIFMNDIYRDTETAE